MREGFLEPGDFDAVVKYLQDAARFAYISGWRKGEVASLEWSDVDRTNARITLRREHSKNREPRVPPLTETLAALIDRRWDGRQIKAAGGTALARFVFHRAGRQIGDFRNAWAKACKAAGVMGTLFHDLRRSAVRNMERAGVSQTVAMKVTGHKTAAVYRRYRIVDEADVREALTKTEAATRPGQVGPRVVLKLSVTKNAAE